MAIYVLGTALRRCRRSAPAHGPAAAHWQSVADAVSSSCGAAPRTARRPGERRYGSLGRGLHRPRGRRPRRGRALRRRAPRRRPGGEIAGTLPVALTRSLLFGTYATSLPIWSYGGVLAADAGVARALVDAAWAWARARGARHLILRHTKDRPLDLPATLGKATCTLPLPASETALWSAVGSKVRNHVRKAGKAGLAHSIEGAGGIRAFHDVFAENMRDLGTPALGQDFFRVLVAELGDAAEVHVVRKDRTPAAVGLAIRFRDRYEVPWASSLRRYRTTAANMLLYWHLIRRAALSGARVFDFGRSTPGSGPHQFKLGWGARPELLPWYYVAPNGHAPTGDLSPSNPRYESAIRLWQRLPVGVTRVVGAYLARALP